MFDGRVRNGNGSDHSFKATKNLTRNTAALGGFSENCTQENIRITIRELKSLQPFEEGKEAIKPHDRLVLVR